MTSLLRLEESSVGRTTDIILVNVEGKGCITLTQDCYFTIKIKKKIWQRTCRRLHLALHIESTKQTLSYLDSISNHMFSGALKEKASAKGEI